MCFSAPASFVASGGLAVLGGASLAAKKEDRILAAIPILFGIQQAFEGIQWLYLNKDASSLFAGYGFLFFAFIVWPIYAPSVVFALDKKRRKILKWFMFLGIGVAIYSFILLLTQSLTIQQRSSCINYTFNFPLHGLVTIAYFAAVFVPMLISSRKTFRWFGIVIALLAIISWIFFAVAFTSVWCFFAAIVSSMFFVYIK